MSTAPTEPYVRNPLWMGASADEHFVQFYEDDATLLASLKGYIEHHLHRGAAAIVIATTAHLDALQQQCLAQGLDLEAARQLGQYLPLDASQTLERLSTDEHIDARRFTAIIEPLIVQAATLHPRIVSFDELVALLWNRGRHADAVRLEELWNELARHYAFGQYCAYPMHRGANALPPITAEVKDALPGPPPYPSTTDTTARLAKAAALQHEARLLAVEAQEQRAAAPAPECPGPVLVDFFDQAPLPLHAVAADGTIEWVNQSALALLGLTREQYLGRPISEFLADREPIDQVLSRLLAGQNLRDQPARVRCSDGSWKNVLLDCNAMWDNGKFTRSRCCLRELSAGEYAADDRQWMSSLVQESGDAIVMASFDGIIRYWNGAAERLYGYRADEAIGQSLAMLVAADAVAAERARWAQLKLGEAVGRLECTRLSRDGHCLSVSVAFSTTRDASGHPLGIAQVAHDIGARVTQETQLREDNVRKDAFLAQLGHDLRNPLAPIANGTLLLRRMQCGDESGMQSLCDMFDRQTGAINRLVDRLQTIGGGAEPAPAARITQPRPRAALRVVDHN